MGSPVAGRGDHDHEGFATPTAFLEGLEKAFFDLQDSGVMEETTLFRPSAALHAHQGGIPDAID